MNAEMRLREPGKKELVKAKCVHGKIKVDPCLKCFLKLV